MTFTNDMTYPVLIRSINPRGNGKGYVTSRLHSEPTHRKVSLSAPIVKNIRRTTSFHASVVTCVVPVGTGRPNAPKAVP
jgi:hypothetical protein